MIHDRNVRVALATPSAGRPRLRPSALARLLLNPGPGVALLAALLVPMLACVTPVAPDFQDPVSSPNFAPWLHDESPKFGTIIRVPITEAQSPEGFKVSSLVTDPNVGDALYARWILNYPPATSSTTILLDQNPLTRASSTVAQPEYAIKCVTTGPGGWTSVPTPQQLELVVADGQFLGTDATQPDLVVDGAHRVYGNWSIIMPCSSNSTGTSP